MLNQGVFKIRVNRDYIKNKNSTSPQVKFTNLFDEIDLEKYYKPMVELIYKILEERMNCNDEKNNCC